MTTMCAACGEAMETRQEAHRYIESGLDYVTLANVDVRVCRHCGAREVAIPDIVGLHKLMAMDVARSPQALQAQEVRFLRKYMGYSQDQFAKAMGVGARQVRRWEQEGQLLSATAENLLRLLVLDGTPYRDYAPVLAAAKRVKRQPQMLRFRRSGQHWGQQAAA